MNSYDILMGMKDKPKDCWEWDGSPNGKGEYLVRYEGTKKKVHRVSYEMHVSKLKPGDYVWNICGNRKCFNPEHLEKGTRKEYSDYCSLKYSPTRREYVEVDTYTYFKNLQFLQGREGTNVVRYYGYLTNFERFDKVFKMNRDIKFSKGLNANEETGEVSE